MLRIVVISAAALALSGCNERAPKDPPNPVQGGTLVYGLEADTANPWAPYRCSCATSGRATALRSIVCPAPSITLT